MTNKNYDYTPVPSYTAPTEGNMQQAATEIANWIRTKGDGKDVRESLAQAVQLFGDVATQFINQSEGLKGQFNSAVANANTNSEVEAARNSTISGTGYTTLGSRLDAIDSSIKNLPADEQKITTNESNLAGLQANISQLQTDIDSGLPVTTSGLINDNISYFNNSSYKSGGYKVVDFKDFRIIKITMAVSVSVKAYPAKILQFPFAIPQELNLAVNNDTSNLFSVNFKPDGTVQVYGDMSGTKSYPNEIDIDKIWIADK